MKRCPQCQRTYVDDTLRFCLDDGLPLAAAFEPDAVERSPITNRVDPPPTEVLPSPHQARRQALPAYVYLVAPFLIAGLLLVLIVGTIFLVWLKSGSRSGSGSPSPSPSVRRTGGTENNRSPTPSPTSDSSANSLTKLLWGAWTWNSFVVTYAPDGTGTYKNGNDLCFNFEYEVKGNVLHMVALGKQQCGPSGLDYRISIEGDNLRQEYTGNGYVTDWKRVR